MMFHFTTYYIAYNLEIFKISLYKLYYSLTIERIFHTKHFIQGTIQDVYSQITNARRLDIARRHRP